jgi:hypothetical protein
MYTELLATVLDKRGNYFLRRPITHCIDYMECGGQHRNPETWGHDPKFGCTNLVMCSQFAKTIITTTESDLLGY